jgi:tungstate transport system substrate-binding protein
MRRLCFAALALAAAACAPPRAVLHMATTTSVEASGLLTALLDPYRDATGIEVRAVAVGSGRALEILERGDADVALTHDPDAERRLLERDVLADYRKLMYNDFLIAGPAADPAGVRQTTDVVLAMGRIVDAGAAFASRADSSGTHARERLLWQLAGRAPGAAALVETGQGQAPTLRIASERQAYVLTDRATFEQLRSRLRLEQLLSGDPRLLNTYAVMYRAGLPADRAERAKRLVEWLTDGDGPARIGAFRVNDQPVYFVWPAGQPRSRPDDLPHAR